jgi:acetyl/propionyl-CoA carboxylase alpha subunit
VPPNYDSMIGKVIAYGDSREQAMARMRVALSEMVVSGIKTNIPLHQELLLDEKFIAAARRSTISRSGSPSGSRLPSTITDVHRRALRRRSAPPLTLVGRAARGGRAVGGCC